MRTAAFTKALVPDLILMIQMPEMDGLEAIRQIRADRQISHIPIIELTGLAGQSDREAYAIADVNEDLAKPARLKDLATTVQHRLETQKAGTL